MSKQEFWTHWLLGLAAAAIWFWGDYLSIPKDAQVLAASIVPGLVAHALGVSRGRQQILNPPAEATPAPQLSQPPEGGTA